MEAARDGIELTNLQVSVERESDFRGVLGVDPSVPAGPLSVQVRIRLAATDATDDQLSPQIALSRTFFPTAGFPMPRLLMQPRESGPC
jgi:hypothetical protein